MTDINILRARAIANVIAAKERRAKEAKLPPIKVEWIKPAPVKVSRNKKYDVVGESMISDLQHWSEGSTYTPELLARGEDRLIFNLGDGCRRVPKRRSNT